MDVREVARLMEEVLGDELNALARECGVVVRQRRFDGRRLARMIVFTLIRSPQATLHDFAVTAGMMGVDVTSTAVQKRLNQPLADFLRKLLERALSKAVVVAPLLTGVFAKFIDVVIGDSSTVTLPDSLKDVFPGCGGSHGASAAALKLQVRMSLVSGKLECSIEPGRAADIRSELAHQPAQAGSLVVFDLGYFSLPRFAQLNQDNAFFLSRLQHGTMVFEAPGPESTGTPDAAGPVPLQVLLQRHERQGVVDIPVILGVKDRLVCRLIAIRVPEEVANRRRQALQKKARDHGRQASAEYLALQDWTIYVTNADGAHLSPREVIVLYRARWQVELLFKLWKSEHQLMWHRPGASVAERMICLWGKLLGVVFQHWLLVCSCWKIPSRSLVKASRVLRSQFDRLLENLDSPRRFRSFFARLQATLARVARIPKRRKHPAHHQLIANPELLTWIA